MRPGLLICLVLSGCADSAHPPKTMGETQAVLDRIADKCGMPRESWKLASEDTLLFRLGPEPDREKGRCLLDGLRESKLPLKFRPAGGQIQIEPVS